MSFVSISGDDLGVGVIFYNCTATFYDSAIETNECKQITIAFAAHFLVWNSIDQTNP